MQNDPSGANGHDPRVMLLPYGDPFFGRFLASISATDYYMEQHQQSKNDVKSRILVGRFTMESVAELELPFWTGLQFSADGN